jgi:hypothetical protein
VVASKLQPGQLRRVTTSEEVSPATWGYVYVLDTPNPIDWVRFRSMFYPTRLSRGFLYFNSDPTVALVLSVEPHREIEPMYRFNGEYFYALVLIGEQKFVVIQDFLGDEL